MTRDMWFDTQEFDAVAEMISQDVPDVEYAYYSAPSLVKEACYQLFKKQHPGAIVARSQSELKEMVAKGMERVVVVNRSFNSCVSESASYKADKPIAMESISAYLERWLSENKYHMHFKVVNSFKKIIEQSKNWTRK